jgi:capsular exopolysaccharide synthesis family protein
MPPVLQIAAHRETLAGDVVEERDLRHAAFEYVDAKRLGQVFFYTDPNSPIADRFRLLRMRLRSPSATGKLQTVLITSALPGDGKTTVALNLATALAEQRKRKVLLIEADLHRGCIAEQLGLKAEVGLKECLQDGLNPLSAIRRVEPFGWHLLQSGTLRVVNPTELLRPQELSAVLRKLSIHFDWIVVDSPPVLALTDGIALSQVVDGTLVVARAERTSSKAVEDAIALLGRKQVLGLVLNGVSTVDQPYSAYHNYYKRENSALPETNSATRSAPGSVS